MSTLKLRALAGVCALVGAASLGVSAHAATIYGAGSSLLAPYWAQGANCYGTTGDYLVKGVPVTSVTPGALPSGLSCPTTANAIKFDATGSGAGVSAVFAHSPAIALLGSSDAAGTTAVYPSIQYGLSDNSLTASDVSIYNGGGTIGSGATAVTVTAPGVSPTVNCSVNNITSCQFGNPKDLAGAMVQFPVAIDPVAITYNVAGASSAIKLDTATYCKIFNGQITDWNDGAITTLNGGSVTGGVSLPIKLVGRSDSSGTTSIFTRHLAAVCGGLVTTNNYSAGTTTLPSGIVGSFTLANGSSGVAALVNTTAGAIAYIGPDYVLPAVLKTGANTYNLPAATLQNANGDWVAPSAAAAAIAFAAVNPPQSNSDGTYNASVTADGVRTNPQDWVQSTAATAKIAKPLAANAYPIVGTTNLVAYTCYNTLASYNQLTGFLNWGGGADAGTILSNAGLSQLPSNWLKAISDTFVTPTTGTGSAGALNLFFSKVTSPTNTVCSGKTGA